MQNKIISVTQCFLNALSMSDIVMFPLILTLKRALHPTCQETLSHFVSYLTVSPDKDW